MKFMSTTDGYLNADYVKQMFVELNRIVIKDEVGVIYFSDQTFTDNEAAQKYLDELIEELEE